MFFPGLISAILWGACIACGENLQLIFVDLHLLFEPPFVSHRFEIVAILHFVHLPRNTYNSLLYGGQIFKFCLTYS